MSFVVPYAKLSVLPRRFGERKIGFAPRATKKTAPKEPTIKYAFTPSKDQKCFDRGWLVGAVVFGSRQIYLKISSTLSLMGVGIARKTDVVYAL